MKILVYLAVIACITGTTLLAADGSAKPLPPELQGIRKFAFYGDSLTDGSDYPDYVIKTLNKEYPGHDFTYINGAVCGHRAHDLIERLDREILSQQPDLTFILIGTNDKGNVAPIQFETNLRYLVHRLRKGGSRVALINLTGTTDKEKVKRLRLFSDIVVKVAKDLDTRLIDAWAFFEKEQSNGKEMYIAPGDCHHSLDGFRGMARVILSFLGVPESVALVTQITPPANVLTTWEESGPIVPTDKKQPPAPSMVKTWTAYNPASWVAKRHWSIKPLVQRGAWFALQGDANGRTAFARTYYVAPKDGVYEMQLGGGKPLQVWVNGELAYTLPKTNGYHPNAVRTPVFFRKGKNEIILTTGFYAFVGIEPLQDE